MEVFTTVASLVVTVIIVPWGCWVTNSINKIEVQQGEYNSWKAIGPRFTSVDAENLRLKILAETQERLDKKLDAIQVSLQRVNDMLTEHALGEMKKAKP